MDNIISIVAICVTLLLGLLGFIVNSLIQRKSNSIQIITKTRLDRREKTKRIMSEVSMLSNIDYLNVLSKEEEKEVIKKLIEQVSILRSEYTRTFECDIVLLDSVYAVLSALISYINDDSIVNEESLINKREEFIKCADIYIQTEWKRIKLETVGKMNDNRLLTWDEIHKNYLNKYK